MCLLTILYHDIPGCPLLVAANREESLDRPFSPPEIIDSAAGGAAWLGGIDLEAGGTWLGVNQRQIVVAITNRWDSINPRAVEPVQDTSQGSVSATAEISAKESTADAPARSRGLLCRDLLACRSMDAVCTELQRQFDRSVYQACNVVLLSPSESFVVELSGGLNFIRLGRGRHAITNGALDDESDLRIQRVQNELNRRNSATSSLDDWIARLGEMCAAHADGERPPICLHPRDLGGRRRGTVSSTIIALPNGAERSRYLFAAGPPCESAYVGYSEPLQRLLDDGGSPSQDAAKRSEAKPRGAKKRPAGE